MRGAPELSAGETFDRDCGHYRLGPTSARYRSAARRCRKRACRSRQAARCATNSRLKTPYRDGTSHVAFAPLDFLARLAARVPKPRVNLTRYHGLFAPNSHDRARVTKAGV